MFLDTSGLVAVVNADDQWHSQAVAAWDELRLSRRWLITSSLVLVEIGDGLSRIWHRSLAVALNERLRASSRVDVVSVTDEIEAKAWELFRQRPEKEWGMTDCVSMTVMRDRGISEVFTLDHHFAQAGFVPVIGGPSP